jgi:hypothetical protein
LKRAVDVEEDSKIIRKREHAEGGRFVAGGWKIHLSERQLACEVGYENSFITDIATNDSFSCPQLAK